MECPHQTIKHTVHIQLLSHGYRDYLWCLCYQYNVFPIYRLINRHLGTALIVAWYKHKNIIYTIPFTYLVIWGETFTSSNPSKGKRHCTHAPTYIHIPVPLQCILPFYLQLQIYYSWDIPIPQRPLSTLTLITTVSRELFIATLIIMVLNYTLMNICSLVTS